MAHAVMRVDGQYFRASPRSATANTVSAAYHATGADWSHADGKPQQVELAASMPIS